MCATPGRLIDLIDTGKISLSFIQSVVLDEADQMLEQSLEVMCAELLTGRDMPEPHMGRQTLLFSATMPQKIRDLCPKILRNNQLANLTIGHYENNQGGSCASIKQVLRWIPDESARVMAMVEDLKYLWMGQQGKKGRVVIFTNQRLQAGYLANALNQNGISCLHLHGKLDQSVREEVFTTFKRGNADVLVATNVASRGLDFPDISFVVQYNLPDTIDIYTHRIGRTGRVGAIGCALSYVGPRDRQVMPKLIDFLELNKQEVPNFLRDESRRGGGRPPPGRPRR
jgi:ATP-dependent RNA helicase DDX3X